MSDYFLEVKNLTKYFALNNDVLSRLSGKTRTLKAVDDISFFIKPGETLGLSRGERLWEIDHSAPGHAAH